VFEYTSGREMPGASGYERKDKVDFKVHENLLFNKDVNIIITGSKATY
jgi:hypothetical protein